MSYKTVRLPVSRHDAFRDTRAATTGAGQGQEDASAGDRAREAASTGKDQARVASTTSEQARSVASTTQDEAREVVKGSQRAGTAAGGRHPPGARSQANAQVDRLAQGLNGRQPAAAVDGQRRQVRPATWPARRRCAHAAARRASPRGGDRRRPRPAAQRGRNRPGLPLRAPREGSSPVAWYAAQAPRGGNGSSDMSTPSAPVKLKPLERGGS